MKTADHLEIVVKISKFCNLRCTYCYEYPDLGDRARMSLDQIACLFGAIRRHLDRTPGVASVTFAWQGGEPLLIKPDVFRAIGALSEAAFAGARASVSHVVQTNLTALSPAWLAYLAEGSLFDDIGVSFDVVGDCRVDTRGLPTTDTILANLQRLADARVPFAAIAVIARPTLARLNDVYGFFDEIGVETRYLPFNQSVSASQFERHALSFREVADAFAGLFDAWMESETGTRIEPLAEYLGYALDHREGAPRRGDIATQESVFVVDTDGTVWGTAGLYQPEAAYGNVFTTEFADLVEAPARRRAVAAARDRVATICGHCRYFGACPGYAVAFGFPDDLRRLETEGCLVEATVAHILRRLDEQAMLPTEAPACAAAADPAAMAAGR